MKNGRRKIGEIEMETQNTIKVNCLESRGNQLNAMKAPSKLVQSTNGLSVGSNQFSHLLKGGNENEK